MAGLSINSKLPLNSGYEIPILGFGVYKTPADQTEDAVAHALKVGYRHVDSATVYKNEAGCAAAIKNSSIPRSDIFFTTKIAPRDLSYENTKNQLSASLQIPGLEYLDLVLLHAPFGGRAARKAAWKALVEAQKAGQVRSLGVSNFGLHHLQEMEIFMSELESEGTGRGTVDVGQWEIHPWMNRDSIVDWCRKRGVVVEAYSPLVRNTRSEEPILQELSKKYGKSAAQILVRWSLQKGFVPLPKSATPSRIAENRDVYDFELTSEEMRTLTTEKYETCSWDPTTSSLDN